MDEQAQKEAAERTLAARNAKFGFPFTPYGIQLDLMGALYNALANKRSGVFESPTGTGKSLSLLCSTLKWYQDYHLDVLVERSVKEAEESRASDAIENEIELPDWVRQFSLTSKVDCAQALLKQREEARIERKKRVMLMTSCASIGFDPFKSMVQPNKRRATTSSLALDCALDGDLLLEGEDATSDLPSIPTLEDILGERPEDDESDKRLQIIICSRTHSQLAQLLGELRKVGALSKDLSVVTVGSRQQLCVNPAVQQRARNGSHLTDLCRHLCDRGGGCSYKKNSERVTDLVLSNVFDVEETCENAKVTNIEGCAYFGVRKAIPSADVLLVPYNLIVNEEMRQSTGVSVEGNVLVIDEAHNLLDAINDSYGAKLSLAHVKCTFEQLNAYREAYERKLAPKNLLKLKQLTAVCAKLQSFLQKVHSGEQGFKGEALKIGSFLVEEILESCNFKI